VRAQKNPLLLSQKRAVTPFSGIYKAPASSQISAGKYYLNQLLLSPLKDGIFMTLKYSLIAKKTGISVGKCHAVA